MKKIKILHIPFDVCTKDEALARILDVLQNRSTEKGKQIVTPNPEMLLTAQKNHAFREVLNGAWLSIPDGIGILWASTFQTITKGNSKLLRFIKAVASGLSLLFYPRFCTKIFSERISGVDLLESICAVSHEANARIFLLGAKPGVAQEVKKILEIRYPGLNIVGTFPGSPSEDDFLAIQAMIAETQPNILFVAYGAPAQELWIAKNMPKLKSVKIAMGVGGAFDFIAGAKKRAPQFLQRIGLEWFYRLLQEPSRIRRIWNATIRFPLAVLSSPRKRGSTDPGSSPG